MNSGGLTGPILLVHERLNPRRVLRQAQAYGGHARWLYLGRNYLRMQTWERALGPDFARVVHARRLQEIAHEWRLPFLEWTTLLGRRYGDLAWWSSRIGERNTYVSPLFRHLCYLRLAREEAAAGGPLVIISDAWPLLRQIAGSADCRGRVRWIGRPSRLREWVGWGLRLAFVWARYVFRGAREMWDARRTRQDRSGVPPVSRSVRILLHSCMDEDCFRVDGGPYDRYFTILPEELLRRGYDVVIIPWLYNIRRSRRAAFQWFRKRPTRYLLPEDYYTLADYLWAGWVVLSQAWMPRGRQVFDGVDVTGLVRAAALHGAVDTEIARFVRYARFIRTLSRRGFRADIFLDKFENMLTEKPQVIALRTYLPGVRTVGFQHYLAPYPLQLHMFTTAEEAQRAPHPEVIICNSAFSADLFAREGFPRHKLVVGPSLRYLHLLAQVDVPVDQQDGDPSVLVLLPLDPTIAAEILQKLLDAFPEDEGVHFRLKIHPMMIEQHWQLALEGRTLPRHMEPAQGGMGERLKEATCAVVSLGTTAALEVMLAGIPMVAVGREVDLDLNPLAWFDDVQAPVYTADELRREVEEVLAAPQERRAAAREWAKRWRTRCLSPLDERTIGVFLEALAGMGSGRGAQGTTTIPAESAGTEVTTDR